MPVTRVQAMIAGRPRREPAIQIIDLVILDFFSNLSLRRPPTIVLRNPIPATIIALYRPYSTLNIGYTF